MRLSAAAIVVVAAALLVAGCGGGSGSTGSTGVSTAPGSGAENGGEAPGGAAKKATAPNASSAPAGSKVVSCGASGAGTGRLRATAVDCGTARQTMRSWNEAQGCTLAKGASRGSCSVTGFRCQAVRLDRGVAVSCARPGGDIAFVGRPR